MPRGETQTQAALAEKAMLSENPERAIQEMMSTIDDLRSVYLEETQALEEADTKTFLSLQDKKLDTAKRYQQGIEEILARRDEMKRVDPSLRRLLESKQVDFSNLAQSNMKALQRMQRTMERLGNTVRRAAKDAVNKQRSLSYGESGVFKSNDHKVVSTGISETA